MFFHKCVFVGALIVSLAGVASPKPLPETTIPELASPQLQPHATTPEVASPQALPDTTIAEVASPQPLPDTTIIPLIVEEGYPLQVVLTEKVRFKNNEPVHAKIIEPVYAFDREVIPSGTEVEGRITGFQKASKWKRALRMLGGDFTPLRKPELTFDTLVLPGDTRISIEAPATAGTTMFIRAEDDRDQNEKHSKAALAPEVKEPGESRIKKSLWGLSPYRPQSLPVGTHFKAVLLESLDFGTAVFANGALDAVGSPPPSGSVISVRLVTPLDSRESEPGTPFEALLMRPIFSEDHQLICPSGSRLRGEVVDARGAEEWHRNGKLAFRFTTIELPVSLTSSTLREQEVDGDLVSLQAAHGIDDVHINEEGEARISESKKRFISPAFGLLKAGRALNAHADPFDEALLGAYQSKATKQIMGSDSGFGLVGSITGAMIPPVGIGLGVYTAVRSIYSNFIGPGQDIVFPVDTVMELRLD